MGAQGFIHTVGPPSGDTERGLSSACIAVRRATAVSSRPNRSNTGPRVVAEPLTGTRRLILCSLRWTSPTATHCCGYSSTSDTTSATRWSSSASWSWSTRCVRLTVSPMPLYRAEQQPDGASGALIDQAWAGASSVGAGRGQLLQGDAQRAQRHGVVHVQSEEPVPVRAHGGHQSHAVSGGQVRCPPTPSPPSVGSPAHARTGEVLPGPALD